MAIGAGCASTPPPAPAAPAPPEVMGDEKASAAEREAAVGEAWAGVAADDAAGRAGMREATKRLVWKRSAPANVRMAGIRALAEDDDADTQLMVGLLLPSETSWAVIEQTCAMAAERSWTGATPGLVRSWSRPVERPTDDARPERAALMAIHPDRTVEEVIFEVFRSPPEGPFQVRTRDEAWALLCRLDPTGGGVRGLLASLDVRAAGAGADFGDLRAAAADLGAVPTTREQLEWLRGLRSTQYAEFWRAATEAIARLTPEQRDGLELRHAAGVAWAARFEPGLLDTSREGLFETLSAELESAKHRQRTADAPDRLSATKETLEAWSDDLVWGDLLLIRIAMTALRDEDVLREMFAQADHDERDTSTEYGGVLDAVWSGASGSGGGGSGGSAGEAGLPRFRADSYPPRPNQRVADNRFAASPDLLAAGTAALFHYHFHAQRHDNAEYAGPGSGDIEAAAALGRSSIVLTFTSRDALNADYYQPDGARIDLGEIRRPAKAEARR